MSSAISSTRTFSFFFAVSGARGSGDQLAAHETVQEIVHAAGDPRDDVDSVRLKHVFQTFLQASADECAHFLITHQANAIEDIRALQAEIDLIHHLPPPDREDGYRRGVPETRGDQLPESGYGDSHDHRSPDASYRKFRANRIGAARPPATGWKQTNRASVWMDAHRFSVQN
jgi:hypothetical protein